VRELAMRANDRPPGLDQLHDRLLLPSQQAVHRVADRRTVIERAIIAQPRTPPMRTHVGQFEHRARTRVRPAATDRGVDQAQQLELGLGAHARRDRA